RELELARARRALGQGEGELPGDRLAGGDRPVAGGGGVVRNILGGQGRAGGRVGDGDVIDEGTAHRGVSRGGVAPLNRKRVPGLEARGWRDAQARDRQVRISRQGRGLEERRGLGGIALFGRDGVKGIRRHGELDLAHTRAAVRQSEAVLLGSYGAGGQR